jgi:hypothetical protein
LKTKKNLKINFPYWRTFETFQLKVGKEFTWLLSRGDPPGLCGLLPNGKKT